MSEHITQTPTIRRLERSSDRILAGVAGGLGKYFELNPNFFRIGFVVLTLLGGAGILVYLAALLVMPAEGKEKSLAEQALAERRERPWPLVGLAIAGIALAILLTRAALWPTANAGWILLLVVGLAILWISRSERRMGRIIKALTVLIGAALAAVIAAVVLAFSWFNVSLDDGVGDRAYTPVTASAVASSYKLGVGNLRIDLSGIASGLRSLHVKAHVGVGQLRIIVPQGVPVQVDAHAKVGNVDVLGNRDSGRNASLKAGSTGGITVDARVGLGHVEVDRAG
jgi:phage shock protein PspC (stress-responsive transcriptional regulator)